MSDASSSQSGVVEPGVLERIQPCGCVVCYCDNQEQCEGCGAKLCSSGDECAVLHHRDRLVWRRKPTPPPAVDGDVANLQAYLRRPTTDWEAEIALISARGSFARIVAAKERAEAEVSGWRSLQDESDEGEQLKQAVYHAASCRVLAEKYKPRAQQAEAALERVRELVGDADAWTREGLRQALIQALDGEGEKS